MVTRFRDLIFTSEYNAMPTGNDEIATDSYTDVEWVREKHALREFNRNSHRARLVKIRLHLSSLLLTVAVVSLLIMMVNTQLILSGKSFLL